MLPFTHAVHMQYTVLRSSQNIWICQIRKKDSIKKTTLYIFEVQIITKILASLQNKTTTKQSLSEAQRVEVAHALAFLSGGVERRELAELTSQRVQKTMRRGRVPSRTAMAGRRSCGVRYREPTVILHRYPRFREDVLYRIVQHEHGLLRPLTHFKKRE